MRAQQLWYLGTIILSHGFSFMSEELQIPNQFPRMGEPGVTGLVYQPFPYRKDIDFKTVNDFRSLFIEGYYYKIIGFD